MAPSSGYYGLAVVNDDGGSGEYTLGVFDATVDVPPVPKAFVTRLVGIAPNPAVASAHVRFELAHPGAVRLELIDVAGRVRDRLDLGTRDPGPSEATWDLRSTGGHASDRAAGIYFMRLVLDGHAVGAQRIVVLG